MHRILRWILAICRRSGDAGRTRCATGRDKTARWTPCVRRQLRAPSIHAVMIARALSLFQSASP